MTAQTRLAVAHQGQQARLADAIARLSLSLWRQNVRGPGVGTDAYLEQLRGVLRRQHDVSRQAAQTYYRTARRLEAPTAPVFDLAPTELDDDRVRASIVATGFRQLSDALARGDKAETALEVAGQSATRAVRRLALSGGRESLLGAFREDRVALGYYWVTRQDGRPPCHWCAMLASRGAVYKADSWPDTDPRPEGFPPGAIKANAHDKCACHLAPVWSRSQELPDSIDELYGAWLDVTGDYDGEGKMKAWRRWYDQQQRQSAAQEAS